MKRKLLTLDIEKGDAFKHELTIEERSIRNVIAAIYYENQEEERAIHIWGLQKESFTRSRIHPVFRVLEWELAIENLATSMVGCGNISMQWNCVMKK